MKKEEIFSHIDHTLLKADAPWSDIRRLCREALEYGAASVCVPPCYVSRVRSEFPELTIATVIGFPLGYSSTAVKVFETAEALGDGADEIDMVINLTDVKNRAFLRIRCEIAEIKRVCGDNVLKVIVETCYLTQSEKERLCQAVAEAGADYIKTSTGFGSAGAQLADIRLFRNNLPDNVKIKAAGGIRDRKTMEDMLRAGADRLGCSSGVKALYGGE